MCNGKIQNIEAIATSLSLVRNEVLTTLQNDKKILGDELNKQISDLKTQLNEEFYFIRLKSRIGGDLDWNYENEARNINFNNQYVSEKERLLLRNHQWLFGNKQPAIKE